MKAKIKDGVRIRTDKFGGVCYVPHRDDFFALDVAAFTLLSGFTHELTIVSPGSFKAVKQLAKLGILETISPITQETPYCGPSFIGEFEELVTISEPLVVNCFSTAFCPLSCIYCHADDLMREQRDEESESDISKAISTASAIPAMVAVITGGDPLTKPKRAQHLIRSLAPRKSLVLDTSGVGDIETLLPDLLQHSVHIRVSLDSATIALNDQQRPVNPKVFGRKGSSFEESVKTIKKCLDSKLSVTVQTVVTTRNDSADELTNLRDLIISLGVKNWVLHIAVEGGSARRLAQAQRKQKRPLSIIPNPPVVYDCIRELVSNSHELLDIRCTDTGSTPNSVLLVDSKGDLFTEGLAKNGKVQLYSAGRGRPDELKQHWAYVDRFGHARRYLNWNGWMKPDSNLIDNCVKLQIPRVESRPPAVVETEAKWRLEAVAEFEELLESNGATLRRTSLQRDEYYDTPGHTLEAHDFVVRLRYLDDETLIALKGQRFESRRFDISRIELEFPTISREDIKSQLGARNLQVKWYFEKRRRTFSVPGFDALVEIDEIPELGFYVEFEGLADEIHRLESLLQRHLVAKETRNYKEIFVDYCVARGLSSSEIKGAQFNNPDRQAKQD